MAKGYQQNKQLNTRKLENDYVRTTDSQMQHLKKKKVAFRRRMLVFTVFALTVMISLISMNISQNARLEEKQAQKEKVLAELKAVKEKQQMLNLQIAKLEDDEYIAKLARKEYFLSEDGEIIFTIPKEDKKQDEKEKKEKNKD